MMNDVIGFAQSLQRGEADVGLLRRECPLRVPQLAAQSAGEIMQANRLANCLFQQDRGGVGSKETLIPRTKFVPQSLAALIDILAERPLGDTITRAFESVFVEKGARQLAGIRI